MRLIKSTLKNTFPNFTAAALNSTQSAIDAAVTAVTGGTVVVGAGYAASPSLSVNAQGGLYSPSPNHVAIATGGVAAVTVNSDQSVNFASALAVAGLLTGKGALPIGTPLPWLTDTAPSGYLMANGQAVSRTTYAALFAVFGTFWGIGDGSTTFNLPNLCEVSLIGKKGMGGAAARGIVNTAEISTLGAVAGEERHTLTLSEAPTGQFTFNDVEHTHGVSHNAQIDGNPNNPQGGPGAQYAQIGQATITIQPAFTGCSITDHAGGGSHNTLGPVMACNWIIFAGV